MNRMLAVLSITLAGLARNVAAEEIEIIGQLVDSDHAAVANARVYWVIEPELQKLEASRVVEGQSDAKGVFRLQVKDHPSSDGNLYDQVWISSPNFRVSCVPAQAARNSDNATPTRFQLRKSEGTTFRIVDPDGRPLAGQLVEPISLATFGADYVPKPLAESLGELSDDYGMVTFRSLSFKDVPQVRLVTEKFGTQYQRCYLTKTPGERTIRLQPSIDLPGTLKTTAGQAWDPRLRLTIWSQKREAVDLAIPPGGLAGATRAQAVIAPDDKGRFSVPAIVDGILRYNVTAPVDAVALPDVGQENSSNEQPTEVELKLVRTNPIQGTVVNAKTKKPMAKVPFRLTMHATSMSVVSDANGYFQARVPPGPVRSWIACRTPYGEISLSNNALLTHVAEAPASAPVTVGPIEIPPVQRIAGQVTQPQNEPRVSGGLLLRSERATIGYGYAGLNGSFELFVLEDAEVKEISVLLDGESRACRLVAGSTAPVLVVEPAKAAAK